MNDPLCCVTPETGPSCQQMFRLFQYKYVVESYQRISRHSLIEELAVIRHDHKFSCHVHVHTDHGWIVGQFLRVGLAVDRRALYAAEVSKNLTPENWHKHTLRS